ncbi:MAG: cytochrome c3 family protein [Pseudomonadota bacterium]
MRLILVTERTRAGSDETSHRETVLGGDEIRLGRGSPMEVNLPEIDVDYHHATVREDAGVLRITAVGENGLIAGKKRVHDLALSPGVSVRIDRYEFSSEPGRDGADHVLIMKVLPATADGRAKRREKRTLDDVLPSPRLLSWGLAIAILAVFIAWPMSSVLTRTAPAQGEAVLSDRGEDEIRAPHPIEALWSSGPLSKAHAGIGGECAACHQRPFERTTNGACLSCHATTAQHFSPQDHPHVGLADARCSSCHQEHEGGTSPVVAAASLCTDCHSALASIAPGTSLKPISGFIDDHPNFEPAIITAVTRGPDGALHPTLLPRPFPKDAILQEKSGLRFPHDKHLAPDGVVLTSGKQRLTCKDCHQVEADGNLMRPINMERDCGGCHQMAFAPAGTAITLPHADEAGIARIVRDYFDERVAEGSVTLPAAPTNRRRRIGGGDRNLAGAALTPEWASEETERQLDAIFSKTLCATCHVAEKAGQAATASGWLVHPALLQRHWMPRARFSHKSHQGQDCASCHAATQSQAASDVLMPQLAQCRECHTLEVGEEDPLSAFLAGGHELAGKGDAPAIDTGAIAGPAAKPAPAECITCHRFHRDTTGPISPAHAALFKAARREQ